MNYEGETVLDLAKNLPEDSDKAAILHFLKEAFYDWAAN